MSVADQSVPLANLSRRVPFTVRFSPQFVNRMCDRLQKSTPARTNVTGLLFGRSELELSEVQVFRSFPETADDNYPRPSETDELAALVEDLLAAARKDPEISALQLLGWYAFRPTGGLHETDVAFHNRYFRQPNEIALILRPEQHPNVLFEIYSRSGTTLLSEDEHRWGSLRLPTDTMAAGPIDVAMRAKIGDDFYLRAYQVSKNLDRAERREHRANAIESVKGTLRSFFRPKPKRTIAHAQKHSPLPAAPATPPALLARAAAAGAPETPVASNIMQSATSLAALPQTGQGRTVQPRQPAANSATTLQNIHAGDPPALPAVIKPPKRGVPWFSSVVVAAIAAGGTIAFINHWNFFNGAQAPAFLRAIFPDTGLGLRAEGQGDRVLLSWNRHNAVVTSSKGGVLHIDDGPLHRDVQLDSAQIANGAVLYRPGSDDVSFRLQVHGQQGAAVAETMRVLDGAKTPSLQAKSAPPDVSPSTTPPSPAAPVPLPEPRSRPDTPVTAPLKTRSTSSPPLAPSQPPPAPAVGRADRPRTSEENRPASTGETAPLPSVLGSTASSATHTEGSEPNPGAPTALSEARSPSTSQQLSTETPKPAAPSALPDSARLPDSLKAPNSEEAPARKLTDFGSPSAAPPSSPAKPLADTRTTPLFVPPRPLKQILPDLRSFGPTAIGATAQVEVAVRVNKKGRVTEAYLVGDSSKVPPHLARAALGAAKLWIFQPATLRGKDIPSDHTIVFEFHPAGH